MCVVVTVDRLDTLLNVFLAIAVDNLANAQELTAAENADKKAMEEAGALAAASVQLRFSSFAIIISQLIAAWPHRSFKSHMALLA